MWLSLCQDQPDDYLIATGATHSVKERCEEASAYAGLDWTKYVEIDERYYRPAEVDLLIGDASKAKRVLGGEAKTRFKDLVKLMVDTDLKTLEDQLAGKVAREDVGQHGAGRQTAWPKN